MTPDHLSELGGCGINNIILYDLRARRVHAVHAACGLQDRAASYRAVRNEQLQQTVKRARKAKAEARRQATR